AKFILMAALLALPSRAQFRADTILSVLRINDVVFVSTRTGLFQSTVSQQKWTPVKLPKGVLPGGCLNSGDAGTTKIYYSPPVSALTDRSNHCAVGFGLWMSADSGKIWKKVDATHWFKSVLARKDGVLYASARVPTDKSNVVAELEIYGGLALVSANGGKTWVDIGGADPIPLVTFLSTCSKNPAHVCAGGMGVRGYNMEYAPESKKWTVTPSLPGATDPKDPTAEEYLASGGMSSSTSECCYMQQATLENYYSLGFGDVLQRPGVTLEAEKKRYEFNGGAGPKIVDVSLNLLPAVPGTSALAVLDLDDAEICWGLRYVDPAGAQRQAAPLITRLNNPALGRAHLLEVGKPYRRQIDLEGLGGLRKPGLYRMVLIFDNGKLKKKDENVWTGRIAGTAVFEVEIK
ncbi:MAG TPA: hypothetical protein VGF61_19495, partial [Candidatus Acidoferrum sp.]